MTPDQLSARMLERMCDTDLGDPDRSLLATVTGLMVELGMADSVSITERTPGGDLSTHGATDALATTADRIQDDFREGPCVDAVYTDGLLHSDDVRGDPRWPRWAPAVADAGMAALISVHLGTSTQSMGALNLFYRGRRELATADVEAARRVALHASVELAHSRHDAHLWRAVEARTQIGQAQGILMERFHLDTENAFAVLRRTSQDSNTKLHVVAAHLIQSGDLPDITDGDERPMSGTGHRAGQRHDASSGALTKSMWGH